MRSTWWTRAVRATLAAAFLATTAGAGVAAAKPNPSRPGKRSGTNLFALTFGVMNVNNFFCGINNIGELCVDPHNSPVVGGGFWPKGTPDQYIFNSGLQLAGQVDPASFPFSWAGDTTGAFFMDPRGDQTMGDPITLVYSSLDPSDAASWPNGAKVRDTSIYNGVLIGRDNISQEDLWVRTWEGNPAFLSGRTHPMGILVEERGMAWNFPSGNEDIIYFVFTFYNVTASDPAVYNNPTVDPAIQSEIAAIGVDFQARNEARFGVNIPSGGYAITNMYAAFFSDQDVGDAGRNYGTAILPFNMMTAYKADFLEPNWTFPADIFGPPFVKSPGFIGMKFLKSPAGLTIWSNTLNSGTGYPDPVGVKQMFRYLSGGSSPAQGDFPCTFQGQQKQKHFCFAAQNFADTRGFQSSGPFTLLPGHSQTIVEAYIQAAPTAVVTPFVGGDFKPGIPASGTEWFTSGGSLVRPIEKAMGYLGQQDVHDSLGNPTPDGIIQQDEVQSVPRSLLDKALVAQAIFDNKFLLPFAPAPPAFFLIPGDNQVTVVWQKSTSEADGDPFFQIASDNTSALYDPNFREFDVEGYRIYRGRSTSTLQLEAQFDYASTTMTDFTGAFAYTADLDGDGKSECAPELGLEDDCPVRFQTSQPFLVSSDHDLTGDVIQIPPGGRVMLGDSSVLIIKADTAVTGGASGYPALANTGVNFAYVDRGVRNSFNYFYAVTAFDVNSLKSGPTSLESARITRAVTPRASSAQVAAGQLSPLALIGTDNVPLNPNATPPTINATTGIFSGPAPPTDGIALVLAAFLPDVLDTGTLTLTIDSIQPGYQDIDGIGSSTALKYFLRVQTPGGTQNFVIPVGQDLGSGEVTVSVGFPALFAVQNKAVTFGGDSTFPIYGSTGPTVPGTWRITGWGRGQANTDPANSSRNGPRWWLVSPSGTANENAADPNSNVCTPSVGTCQTGVNGFTGISVLDGGLNAGRIIDPANDTVRIFHVQGYSTVQSVPQRDIETLLSSVARAADFTIHWGAGGVIDSVHDVTHHMQVPFKSLVRASWGLITAASFTTFGGPAPDGNNALLTWSDIYCVAPIRAMLTRCGGGPSAAMQSTATLTPIAMTPSLYANTSGLSATGNGFIFYLNGHFFLMQMAALPPAGTVWGARFYSGAVTYTAADGYGFVAATRPPAVPGLRIQAIFTGTTVDPTKTTDAALARVHTVPDPYYVTTALEATANTKILKFVNLPARCIVRIYSVSGVLVQVLTHNDAGGGSDLTWNLRNRNNQFVASGVYFYHVETPDGKSTVKRFTVVNFAP